MGPYAYSTASARVCQAPSAMEQVPFKFDTTMNAIVVVVFTNGIRACMIEVHVFFEVQQSSHLNVAYYTNRELGSIYSLNKL